MRTHRAAACAVSNPPIEIQNIQEAKNQSHPYQKCLNNG
jgi:hypothetical protein